MTEVDERPVGPVELTLPASSEHLRVLRLVSSALAASVGLNVDRLDDLRIAIGELCSLLIEHAPEGARLRVTLSSDGGHLVAAGELLGEAPVATLDPVSQMILDGLDVDWTSEAPSPRFRLVAPGKERRDSS